MEPRFEYEVVCMFQALMKVYHVKMRQMCWDEADKKLKKLRNLSSGVRSGTESWVYVRYPFSLSPMSWTMLIGTKHGVVHSNLCSVRRIGSIY